MSFNILKYMVIVLILSRITWQQTTPEERCEESGNGTIVCMDCFRGGRCLLMDGTYTVTEAFICPSFAPCDDSILFPTFGQCTPLPASSTNCGCTSTSGCTTDPNNPAVILHCEASPPVSDDACPSRAVDLSTCSCASCPDTCPFVDDPNDACGSYFVCSGSDLIPVTCSGTLCFDQESCGCVKRLTTEPATTKATEPIETSSAPVTCPPGCPFTDDPNDSCSSYFVCSGPELIPITCTGTLCFDQESCGCVNIEVTTTEPPATTVTEPMTTPSAPVTSLTCPPGCPFLDDPNDSCAKYFVCSGGDLIPVTCTGTLCFDQTSCGCVDKGSLSTTVVTEPITTPTAPVTSLTCPPGCPFLDDPNDSCSSYFVCSGTDLIPVTCADTFCFDQALCGCVDNEGSTSELPTTATITTTTPPTTTTALTCPEDCNYVDDPNDSCSKFYICSGDELFPSECSGILCFDQAACQCN